MAETHRLRCLVNTVKVVNCHPSFRLEDICGLNFILTLVQDFKVFAPFIKL